ncbi:UDP-N-acetylmuramate--L-alanine ligase [SAR86 cluster bacterium]|nr:UDP-N-acetylmuramate--L-alanine ligase [SAR86 cluster bacterium]
MLGTNKIKKIHFIGVGGAGMSGIAEILLNLNFQVSGSDLLESKITKRLESLGLVFFNKHEGENLSEVDLVVFSSAIKQDNPEIIDAKKNNIKIVKRAEMLAELTNLKKSILIAGSHGKTTTTCIAAHIFKENNFDPTYIIGGKVSSFESNANLGEGKHIFAEADESDGSFLLFNPDKAIITGIDNDHLETYQGNIENLKKAFVDFIKKVKSTVFILDLEKKWLKDLSLGTEKIITYGFSSDADYKIIHYSQNKKGSSFVVKDKKSDLEHFFEIGIHGQHNILNSLAAILIALDEGIRLPGIRKALSTFAQVERRFEIISDNVFGKRITLVDDYGHHPSELKATIETIKEIWPDKKVVMAFQPHRYSRTKALFHDFVNILSKIDNLILMEIYPASELPIKNYSSEDLFREVKKNNKNVILVNGIEEAFEEFKNFSDQKYIFLTQGAGNTSTLALRFK